MILVAKTIIIDFKGELNIHIYELDFITLPHFDFEDLFFCLFHQNILKRYLFVFKKKIFFLIYFPNFIKFILKVQLLK
jgi:hypothetical protein